MKPVLCIAPYLPLREELRIGSWHLLPLSEVGSVLEGAELKFAQGLAQAYGVKSGDRQGAVAFRRASSPIAAVAGRDVHRLNIALMCGVLDANEGAPDDQQCTSENALVFAHPMNDGSFTSTQDGALIVTLRGISLDGSQAISAPAEMTIPDRTREVDGELASAFYREFANGSAGRRRLLTAEWLQVASRNTTMISLGVRAIALRSGFEALLNVGEKYPALGKALHQLVEKPTTRRWRRSWLSLNGKPQSADLTALQWWLYNFCFLRNAIAHGTPLRAPDWRWKGEHHLLKAERELRRAMRCELVRLGHDPLLELTYPDRDDARRMAKMVAAARRLRGA